MTYRTDRKRDECPEHRSRQPEPIREAVLPADVLPLQRQNHHRREKYCRCRQPGRSLALQLVPSRRFFKRVIEWRLVRLNRRIDFVRIKIIKAAAPLMEIGRRIVDES